MTLWIGLTCLVLAEAALGVRDRAIRADGFGGELLLPSGKAAEGACKIFVEKTSRA
jgi:hypothetical protein